MSSPKIQVAIAGDVAEAEEMHAILEAAGIEVELQPSEEDSVTVLVPETELDTAKEALEALTEPDDLISEP